MITNITTNSNTDIKLAAGQRAILAVSGTFDSATASLQYSPDGGSSYVTYQDGALTAAAEYEFVAITPDIRINVAGGGASIDLDVVVTPILNR